MRTYKCHKIVEAAKIEKVVPIYDAGMEGIEHNQNMVYVDGGETFELDKNFKAEAGKYLVRYSDGYLSVSPAQAFEEGYTEVKE